MHLSPSEKFSQAMQNLMPAPATQIAIGVSGGADSLALMILAANWQKKHAKNTKLFVLCVDHGLRKNSHAEALMVEKYATALGLSCQIIVWKHPQVTSALEEKARVARYKLIGDFCKQNNINHLLIAHHSGDDAETFLMNLSRGSGLFGLSSIAPISENNGMQILRPLLNFSKNELEEICVQANLKWAVDKSNFDTKYLRARIRKFMPKLETIDIDMQKICYATKELRRARGAIEFFVQKARLECVQHNTLNPAIFKNYPAEISLRVLAQTLQEIGGTSYPPRMESLEKLWHNLQAPKFKKCTLNHCQISQNKQGEILIKPESKKRG